MHDDFIELKNVDDEQVFVVPPDFFDSLDELAKQINVKNKAEVLQYALTLLYAVSKERHDSGAKLYLSYPKGGFREIRFWNLTKPALMTDNGIIVTDKNDETPE